MITGELKGKIDRVWDAFWSGCISNPIDVIEQITYLLFIRRLDDLHTLAENKANRLNRPVEQPVFKAGPERLPLVTVQEPAAYGHAQDRVRPGLPLPPGARR